jgi:hypothetical protein
MAAPFRHRREARRPLECIGGGVTGTVCPDSAEEAGSTDRASARPGGQHGAVGRLPGAVRHGRVDVGNGRQDGSELSHERRDEERMRGAHACSGREWRRVLEGVDAWLNHVGIAPMMGVEAARQSSAARQLSGFAGGPWGEQVTEARGVLVVTPFQDVRAVVVPRTGAAVSQAHVVADQTATLFDEWLKRTQRGALGGERVECVARLQQALQRQCCVRGVVCRMAGCEGCAVCGPGARMARAQHEACLLTHGVDERTVVECKAHRDGAACEPLLEGPCPRVDGLWCVVELTALAGGRVNGLSADVVCGLSPSKAHEGRTFFWW